jgi:hypothetical protein
MLSFRKISLKGKIMDIIALALFVGLVLSWVGLELREVK